MRCIAHLCNQFLSPLNLVEDGVPAESFADENSFVLRLADAEFCPISVPKNISKEPKETNWSDVRVSFDVFKTFGRLRKCWHSFSCMAKQHIQAISIPHLKS
jgi:hypothetical protein